MQDSSNKQWRQPLTAAKPSSILSIVIFLITITAQITTIDQGSKNIKQRNLSVTFKTWHNNFLKIMFLLSVSLGLTSVYTYSLGVRFCAQLFLPSFHPPFFQTEHLLLKKTNSTAAFFWYFPPEQIQTPLATKLIVLHKQDPSGASAHALARTTTSFSPLLSRICKYEL